MTYTFTVTQILAKVSTEVPSDVTSGAGSVTAPDDCSPWPGKCRLLILAGLTREMSERGFKGEDG